MTRRTATILIGAGLAVAGVSAQVRDDRRAPRDGTAGIEGTVVLVDGRGPATPGRRVIVTLSGAELPLGRSVVSDERGRFVIDGLPAGRFLLTATKPAYLPGAYGASRPGRTGVAIVLGAGERLGNLSLALTRGAAIGGTIREASGEPVFGVTVTAFRLLADGSASAVARTTSDDRGAYRLYGLMAGDYIVSAERPAGVGHGEVSEMTAAEIDRKVAALRSRAAAAPGAPRPPVQTATVAVSSFVPVFHPGAFSPADAAKVSLAFGEDRPGTDIVLARLRTVTVNGTIVGTAPAGNVTITLTQSGPLLPALANRPVLRSGPAGDGPFQFGNVAPGRYVATAVSSVRPVRFARVTVDVGADDVHGVSLVMEPGLQLTGRLVFNGTRPPPGDLTSIRVMLESAVARAGPGGGGRGASSGGPEAALTTDAQGNFRIDGIVPGSYRITTSPASEPGGWWLRSAIVNGMDVLDVPLEIDVTTPLSGAVVTFSDRHTLLTGRLEVPGGRAAADYHIVVFPAERSMWLARARRITSTRPGTDGVYVLRGLPPGGYRLAALTDVGPDDLIDPSFFDALLPASIAVTLADGEQKTQALRVAR